MLRTFQEQAFRHLELLTCGHDINNDFLWDHVHAVADMMEKLSAIYAAEGSEVQKIDRQKLYDDYNAKMKQFKEAVRNQKFADQYSVNK